MPLRPPRRKLRARLAAGLGLAAMLAPGPARADGPANLDALLDGLLAPLGLPVGVLGAEGMLALLAGLCLLLGLLAGLVLGRRAAAPAAAPATGALPPAQAAEALAERLAQEQLAQQRRQAALHEFAQDFSAAMGGALDSIATTSEQLREAAGQVAAHAEMAHEALRDTAQEVAATAGRLEAFVTRGAQLSEALHGLTDTLRAVGDALAEEDAAHPAPAAVPATIAPDAAQPLPLLAADIALALDSMLATAGHLGAMLADTAAQLAEIARSAGASGEAARTALAASGTVASDCTQMTLEFATFLDSLERAGDRRQFDRYPTDLEAGLLLGTERRPVRVTDISRGGCALAGESELPLGTAVEIALPGLAAAVPARIARISHGSTGLMFRTHDPLAGVLEMLIVAPRRGAA